MEKIKVVIIGVGIRGRYTYGNYFEKNKNLYEVVAVVENKIGRRNKFQEIFNLPQNRVFENLDDFFKVEKIANAVIISSIDNTHYDAAVKSLKKGYNVLVEGPVANSLDKLVNLENICEENKDKIFMAAMPYRYSSFFKKLKNIIESKKLGQLININYNSYIGYDKFAHKYVRGNWRLDSDTAPICLTNSCYDLDMLEYLTNSTCEKVSSFGELNYFKRENLQLDMSELCSRCSIDKECPYCAHKIYLNDEELSKGVHINPTKININKILKNSQYGQCVYSCDNNVCDNLISILKFKNNMTASLNISAFTKEESTNIRLMFTHGEVYGDFQNHLISIKKFIDNKEKIIRLQEENINEKLIEDFLIRVKNKDNTNIKSKVSSTISSHALAFAAEFARVNESVVDVDKFYDEAIEMTKSIEELFL
ncbi:MAG: Gfo/Idh/MocA family protein [Terrisporobacter sp.]|uniref:Gfo/Idh/MocA family protein n=1 Tax=Terrisporobacter sp. TaxID=1965305 RepID=UPI003995E420